MIQELPPAKHADDYTKEERAQITQEAAEAAVELAEHMKRLVEIDERIKHQEIMRRAGLKERHRDS